MAIRDQAVQDILKEIYGFAILRVFNLENILELNNDCLSPKIVNLLPQCTDLLIDLLRK